MKLSPALGACLIAACHPSTQSATPERCGPAVPPEAQHPLAVRAGMLAGDYELIQVQTQPVPGHTSVGRLHLAPLDSTARAHAVGGAVRDLIGWLDVVEGDTTLHLEAGSRDRDNPGAVLAGDRLRLGRSGSIDAHTEHLVITAVAPDGFFGWWKAEPGWEISVDTRTQHIRPDPAGYFCALRVRP